MKRYVAFLRGINVSGKNKISMAELKKGFAELGFAEVVTYLNSGNIAFSSVSEDQKVLVDKIMGMINEKFSLDIPVFVILQEELEERINHAPDWWGTGNKEIYDNMIFLMPPFSYDEFYDEIGKLKEEYEKADYYKNVVFWSFDRKCYQKTNWWSKTASAGIKDKITIRTANTVRKSVTI